MINSIVIFFTPHKTIAFIKIINYIKYRTKFLPNPNQAKPRNKNGSTIDQNFFNRLEILQKKRKKCENIFKQQKSLLNSCENNLALRIRVCSVMF